jgi:hypothetical protein
MGDDTYTLFTVFSIPLDSECIVVTLITVIGISQFPRVR